MTTSWSWWSPPCSPAATYWSRTCPAAARRRSPGPSRAASAALPPRAGHRRPAAGRHHRLRGLGPATTDRLRVRARADLRQRGAGRRAQPAPPRTQSAFLEAMEESAVTVDGRRYPLPDPFFVIATQNPLGAVRHLPAAGGPARPVRRGADPRPADAGREPRSSASSWPARPSTTCSPWSPPSSWSRCVHRPRHSRRRPRPRPRAGRRPGHPRGPARRPRRQPTSGPGAGPLRAGAGRARRARLRAARRRQDAAGPSLAHRLVDGRGAGRGGPSTSCVTS